MSGPNKKVTISSTKLLEGIRVGFYFPQKQRVFVSPTVHKLIDDDLDLMRKNLQCYVMPVDTEGKEVYSSLEEWVGDLLARNADIHTKSSTEENKHDPKTATD